MLAALSQSSARTRHLLGRFAGDQRGMGAVGMALALPALVGAAGIGVEAGMWYLHKRDLQVAADASAVAGAFELARSNEASITAAAIAQAAKNGFVAGNGATISVTPDTSGGAGTVLVQLRKSYPRLFSAIFMDEAVTIGVKATASVQISGDACVLALDTSLSKALDIQGSTFVDMPSCTLAANSNDAIAIAVSGSASLSAASLWTRGGVDTGGSAAITLPGGILDHVWALADPYANLTIPSFGGCDFNNKSYSNETTTINPGVYCGGLSFGANANVTLNPGTYYILDGDLTFNAQSVVRCNCNGDDGVTLVLTTKGSNMSKIGRIRLNGGADVQLSAPSDPNEHFVGVLMYQDRRATNTQANKLNGGSAMTLKGAVYTPAQPAEWTGNNGSSASNCTRLIARSVTFIGNSYFNNAGCEAAGVKPIEVTSVRVSA
jgi:Flp pilus assembly protein TadG